MILITFSDVPSPNVRVQSDPSIPPDASHQPVDLAAASTSGSDRLVRRRDGAFEDPRDYEHPFKCALCGKGFHRHDNLKAHTIRKHGDSSNQDPPNHEAIPMQTDGVEIDPDYPPLILDNNEHGFYDVALHSSRRNERFNTFENVYDLRVRNHQGREDEPDLITHMVTSLEDLLTPLTRELHENDLIGVTLSTRSGLDYPIRLPLMKVAMFSVEKLLSEIQRVLNSNEDFELDRNLLIRVVVVRLPRGQGRRRRHLISSDWMHRNRCVVIIDNQDQLCCARAIAVSLAALIFKSYQEDPNEPPIWLDDFMKEHFWGANKYRKLQQRSAPQESFALALHAKSGVPLEPCGLAEIDAFQKYLNGYGVNLRVFTRDHQDFLVRRGDPCNPHNIYIFHSQDHYNAIVNTTAFLRTAYFCHICCVGYSHRSDHKGCVYLCDRCFTEFPRSQDTQSGHKGDVIQCSDCYRNFHGRQCFDEHKKPKGRAKTVCDMFYRCPQCWQQVKHYKGPHMCHTQFCNVCKIRYSTRERQHICYMQPINEKLTRKLKPVSDEPEPRDILEELLEHEAQEAVLMGDELGVLRHDDEPSNDPKSQVPEPLSYRYVFFDLETALMENQEDVSDTKSVLKVNCACALSFCNVCRGKPGDLACQKCQRERKVTFYGIDALEEFCHWLFKANTRNDELLVFAHNLQVC